MNNKTKSNDEILEELTHEIVDKFTDRHPYIPQNLTVLQFEALTNSLELEARHALRRHVSPDQVAELQSSGRWYNYRMELLMFRTASEFLSLRLLANHPCDSMEDDGELSVYVSTPVTADVFDGPYGSKKI